MELLPLFTVPVVFLAGGVFCSLERFTVLLLLRPLSLCCIVVLLSEELADRPEVLVFLFTLDLAGAVVGRWLVPELLETVGR